jgi:hypothetical protein
MFQCDRYHQSYCNQREGLHHGMTMLKNEDIIEMDLDLDNGQLWIKVVPILYSTIVQDAALIALCLH